MKEELLVEKIERLVKYNFTLEELKELAPMISTENFSEKYKLSESIKLITKETAQNQLRNEIRFLIEDEKNLYKESKFTIIKTYKFHALAASVLLFCAVGIIKSTTGYNNESKYRSSYIETTNNERK